nr:HPr family phosphocarrier protein [uncultured Acetatifactor sp.]
MTRVTICLNTVDRVKRFCDAAEKFNSEVDAIMGRYIIDAKSALGVYALDLRKPIDVEIHSDDEEEIKRFNMVMEEFKIG